MPGRRDSVNHCRFALKFSSYEEMILPNQTCPPRPRTLTLAPSLGYTGTATAFGGRQWEGGKTVCLYLLVLDKEYAYLKT